MTNETPILERLQRVPHEPGVYLWKDAQGTILYVGKSKDLRDRMRSYLGTNLHPKTRRLMSQVTDFDTVITSSELEAFLLEMNLIKQHRPRYNILLRDDKTYPYIKVTLQNDWPQIFTTRRLTDDGSKYYGPYANAGAVRRTLGQLNRIFAFRPPYDCKDEKFNRHRKMGKPCIYHDIKRCLGPCVPGLVTQQEYRATIEAVCAFLEGKTHLIVADLQRKMNQAANDMEFERAAFLRDQIRDIEEITQTQQVLKLSDATYDVIAVVREGHLAIVHVLYIRNGKMVGSEPFVLENVDEDDEGPLLQSFITQFYADAAQIPPVILLPVPLEDGESIAQWLAQKGGHVVRLEMPKRGSKRQLIDLAQKNAQQKLEATQVEHLNSQQRASAGLSELRDLLGMESLPTRIECYDISNTQGTNSAGAMVVFENGVPKKSDYRKFKIKTVEGANDVASMQEVVRRRVQRAENTDPLSGKEAFWAKLPDLILIDGGAGQLNGAQEMVAGTAFAGVPMVGVVKGLGRDRFDLLLPGRKADDLIILGRNSAALRLVAAIDEETDRFAKQYHRQLRSKSAVKSMLDDIPGIGPKRRQALMKTFGSLDAIRAASVEEIAAVPGMNAAAARIVKEAL